MNLTELKAKALEAKKYAAGYLKCPPDISVTLNSNEFWKGASTIEELADAVLQLIEMKLEFTYEQSKEIELTHLYRDKLTRAEGLLHVMTETLNKYIGDDTAQGWDAKTNEPLNHFEMVNDFREVLAKIAALSEEKKK